MAGEKNMRKMDLVDVQICVTMLMSMLLCHWANQLGIHHMEALVVTTGAIMCVEDSAKAVYKASMIRILQVLCGGLIGVVIVLIDNALGMTYLFYVIVSIGVLVTMLLSRQFGLNYIQGRVSCITMLLVVMVSQGADRVEYAIGRLVGGLVGALVAIVVTYVFVGMRKVFGKKGK